MSKHPLKWSKEPNRLEADPAATLAVDRTDWERLGAVFAPHDDGQGELADLAVGNVETSEGPVEIGIVDYGEDTTYLLVPGVDPDRFATTAAVLESLEAIGAVRLQDDLVDLADPVPTPTLEQRVKILERRLAEMAASSPHEAVEDVVVVAPSRRRSRKVDIVKVDAIIVESKSGSRGSGKAKGITGTVKWFNDEKGFGFITPDSGDRDLFVHHTSIQGWGYRSLVEGAKVSYEEVSGREQKPPSRSSRRN